ncbi:hypothetical protein Gbfr_007_222 [Gluconobacter frateurii M-2]|nr:hypothetical protein Gbfr_007_222 [Gluconobacter frateurii M-2]
MSVFDARSVPNPVSGDFPFGILKNKTFSGENGHGLAKLATTVFAGSGPMRISQINYLL